MRRRRNPQPRRRSAGLVAPPHRPTCSAPDQRSAGAQRKKRRIGQAAALLIPHPPQVAAPPACARTQSEREALQWAAWEKQQKEISKHQELIQRLSGGAQSGRASQAEKALERIRAEGLIEKPFVPKKRSFTFPPVDKMGQKVRSGARRLPHAGGLHGTGAAPSRAGALCPRSGSSGAHVQACVSQPQPGREVLCRKPACTLLACAL